MSNKNFYRIFFEFSLLYIIIILNYISIAYSGNYNGDQATLGGFMDEAANIEHKEGLGASSLVINKVFEYNLNFSLINHESSVDIGDLNKDGFEDIVVDEMSEYGCALWIFEWKNSNYQLVKFFNSSAYHSRSIAVGNFDSDSNMEIAIGSAKATPSIYIFEVASDFSITLERTISVPVSFNDEIEVISGDVDGDNVDEILYTVGWQDGRYGIYDWNGAGYTEVFNKNDGWSYHNRPFAGDIDGDGLEEVMFGFGYGNSKDGDIDIYEYQSGSYTYIKTLDDGRDPVFTHNIGDINGDGRKDLAAGAEVAYSKKIRVFYYDGTTYNKLGPDLGVANDNTKFVSIGDIDGDGIAELVYTYDDYSNLAISEYISVNNSYKEIGEFPIGNNKRLEHIFCNDLDNDNYDEIITMTFTDTQALLKIFDNNQSNNNQKIVPNPPILNPITPNPDHDGDIILSWSQVIGATYYYIYRSTSKIISTAGLTPIANITSTFYTDTGLAKGTYYYVVTALNASGESNISNCESVIVSINASGGNQLNIPGFIPLILIYSIIGAILIIIKNIHRKSLIH